MSAEATTPAALAARCLPALAGAPLACERLAGGGNNRLWRVDGPGGPYVLKHYFRHPAAGHDRLAAEWAFLEHARARGVETVPEPVARDAEAGAALYRFLPGRRLAADEVGPPDVASALELLRALNAPPAARLAPAAEASFSVAEHVGRADARVARLRTIAPGDEVAAAAAAFVVRELEPAWRTLRAGVLRRLGATPPRWALPLPAAERIASPSDFGFHNALRREDGGLVFLDFEYAGSDDPAKLACDFALQPAVPAPRAALAAFTEGVAALVPDRAGALARCALLRPVAAVRWCCILLNHFSPAGLGRRRFAADGAAADPAGERHQQLARARRLLADTLASQGA